MPTANATGSARNHDLLDGTRAVELVQRMRVGDPTATTECYRLLAPLVRHIVRAEIRHGDDTEDLVQDVFVRVIQRLHTLREPSFLRFWVASIARRAAIDHRRARVGGRTVHDPFASDHFVDPSPGPEAMATGRDDLRRLERALRSLNESDACALRLVGHQGAGPADLASAFGTTVGAAKVRLHRARTRLRHVLGDSTSAVLA
jgi:RNA polymerase sigma-70 factor (ECF subfamily)